MRLRPSVNDTSVAGNGESLAAPTPLRLAGLRASQMSSGGLGRDFQRSNLTVTGGFTGLRRGFISDGLFQSQEEIDNHAIQDGDLNNTTIQVGDVKYVDLNDNGVINEQDQKVFGKGNKPANNYSLNLGAEYKNFALSVLLTGASGYDIYIGGEA